MSIEHLISWSFSFILQPVLRDLPYLFVVAMSSDAIKKAKERAAKAAQKRENASKSMPYKCKVYDELWSKNLISNQGHQKLVV